MKSEKDKYHMLSLISGIFKKIHKAIDTENRVLVAREAGDVGGRGRMVAQWMPGSTGTQTTGCKTGTLRGCGVQRGNCSQHTPYCALKAAKRAGPTGSHHRNASSYAWCQQLTRLPG